MRSLAWLTKPNAVKNNMTAIDARLAVAATPWVAATMCLAIGPALFILPAWVAGLTLLIMLLKLFSWKLNKLTPMFIWLPLTVASIVAVAIGFEHYLSGPAIVAFFVLTLSLKWLEAQSKRDAYLMLFAACVLASLGAVHHVAIISLLLLTAFTLVLVCALLVLNGAPKPGKTLAAMLLGSLPLAVLLFVCLPRIPGPLWDFGLAVGLPIFAEVDRNGAGLGGQDTLKLGGQRAGGLDNGTVLVAEFEDWVPPASRLYWRGPVFTHFDGESWSPADWWKTRSSRMAAGFRRSAAFKQEVHGRGDPIKYSIRLAAHGGPWLYGLDIPAGLPAESYLTQDYQLLSMTPVVAETRYRLGAWLDWQTTRVLAATERSALLDYPQNSNASLVALGQEMQARYPKDAHAIVAEGLDYFVRGNFKVNAKFQGASGKDAYDQFMFKGKEGGAEYFAASYVLLMRSAGVPARLVTGYRGGRLMALTDYVLVKQSNAHAWAEVFADKGWERVDVVDAVKPLIAKTLKVEQRNSAEAIAKTNTQLAPVKAIAKQNSLQTPNWLRFFNGLDHWVIHYDADRQSELLGTTDTEKHLVVLGSYLLASLALLTAIAFLVHHIRNTKQADPLAKAWQLFTRRLQSAGVSIQASECPANVADRLVKLTNIWAGSAAGLANDYANFRYSTQTKSSLKTTQLKSLVKQLNTFNPASYQENK